MVWVREGDFRVRLIVAWGFDRVRAADFMFFGVEGRLRCRSSLHLVYSVGLFVFASWIIISSDEAS